jgi:hypothetical protein
MDPRDIQVNFRMPAELKVKLEAAAKENNRSLTAEIVYRLEQTFHAPLKADEIIRAVKQLHADVLASSEATLAAAKQFEAQVLARERFGDALRKSDDPAGLFKAWKELLGDDAKPFAPDPSAAGSEATSQRGVSAILGSNHEDKPARPPKRRSY